jgi:hypothetical protein
MSTFFFRYGDLDLPTDSADVPDQFLYQAFDPGRDALAALFKNAINAEAALVTSGSPSPTSAWCVARGETTLRDVLPVADTFYEMPTPDLMRESAFNFPLLCVYREGGTDDERTLARDRTTTRWGVDYILPPMGLDDLRRLGGILIAAHHIINLCVRQASHPSHENGATQFGPGKGHFARVETGEWKIGPATFGGEVPVPYRALHMTLITKELTVEDVEDATPFEGADISIGVGTKGDILPDLVQASTDVNPDPNHGIPPGQT